METILGTAISLFFMLDPIGNIPLILALIGNHTRSRQRWIILRESVVALLLMFVFLFFGRHILSAIGVQQQALSMTGGVVLFLIGLRMSLVHNEKDSEQPEEREDPFVVPIAIPFIAGPGVLAMVMLMTAKANMTVWGNLAALIIAWLASTLTLLIGQIMIKFLGKKGMDALQRLMGLTLTAMAVQMFMTGFKEFMLSK